MRISRREAIVRTPVQGYFRTMDPRIFHSGEIACREGSINEEEEDSGSRILRTGRRELRCEQKSDDESNGEQDSDDESNDEQDSVDESNGERTATMSRRTNRTATILSLTTM